MSETLEKVRKFWDEKATTAETDCARVDSSRRTQRMRFEAFVLTHNLDGASILDVGCGVGDFYGHLRDRKIRCTYKGVDLSPEMAARARVVYPEASFEAADLLTWPDAPQFDYVVAIAIHNVRVDGGKELLEKLTRKQFALARRAAHLSLLTDRYTGFAPHIQPWPAEEILRLALSITPWVTLRHDYLPHDFSITLYREPYIETQPGLLLE
jgi:SAM-dependent methyltransferase